MRVVRVVAYGVFGAATGAVIAGGVGGFMLTMIVAVLGRLVDVDLDRSGMIVIYAAAGVLGAMLGARAGVTEALRLEQQRRINEGNATQHK